MPDESTPAAAIPFPPMEAELVRELPTGEGWWYEPKWDGFRGVLENLSGELKLWSRNARPLLRYFPELQPLGDLLPPSSALDGEIVIVREGAVAFDVLLWDGEAVWEWPLEQRRAHLEGVGQGFRLSPRTSDMDEVRGWLDRFESLGLDGVVAKRPDLPYLPGSRDGVVKVKENKTADCVVIGVRFKKGSQDEIATLLLGLFRDD